MRRLLTMSVLFLVAVLIVLPSLLTRMTVKPVLTPRVEGTDGLTIHVYLPDTKQVKEMQLGEYLKGVVAAEMPAEFATEALKAQFIVARTYAVKRMQQFNAPGKGGCSLDSRADVCADPATGQAYTSREAAVVKMGSMGAESLWKRLDQVQAETEGLVLTYRGEIIDPLYHSVSGTLTEDAGDYYSQSLPYLKPVDDHWGQDAPSDKLYDTRVFKPDQLASLLSGDGEVVAVAAVAGAAAAGKAPVQILTRTASNRVKTLKVAGVTLSGREFREHLGLRSTNFSVTVQGGDVVVRTVGNGHGVGMSQYGANGMAKAGKTALEILTYYYTDVAVVRLFDE
jgi:stage II sporulation protein D